MLKGRLGQKSDRKQLLRVNAANRCFATYCIMVCTVDLPIWSSVFADLTSQFADFSCATVVRLQHTELKK